MNENIDVLLTTSKVVTRNNPWAHLAAQSFSMGYNVSMLWYYNYQIDMSQAKGAGNISSEQVQIYKWERNKHSILLGLECVGLIAAGLMALYESKSE